MSIHNCINLILDLEKRSVLQKFIGLNINKLNKNSLLKDIEIKILIYYLRYPKKAIHRYYKENKNELDISERTIYRYADELAKEGFLEIDIENQTSENYRKNNSEKPYILSLTGIFYIILNTTGISSIDLIKNILKNYKENYLFNFFLYPIIKEKTIDKVDYDISFFSIILEYLNNICKDIVAAIKWLKSINKERLQDDYLMSRVFIWYNNPGDNINEDLCHKIRFFLKNTLKWDNVDLLRIEPRIEDNVIEILDSQNSTRNSTITILKSEKKAVLRQNGKSIHKFSVIPNDEFLSIETQSSIRPIDDIQSPFMERYDEHVINFLITLRTKLLQSNDLFTNPTFETLSEDERYNKALECLDKELNLK
jgi:hypothetical protein